MSRSRKAITVHFEHEERLMRASRYASLGWHKPLHDAASRNAQRFALAINRRDREAGRALVAYLTQWLHAHTSVADRMMGAHLRNQCLQVGKLVFRGPAPNRRTRERGSMRRATPSTRWQRGRGFGGTGYRRASISRPPYNEVRYKNTIPRSRALRIPGPELSLTPAGVAGGMQSPLCRYASRSRSIRWYRWRNLMFPRTTTWRP